MVNATVSLGKENPPAGTREWHNASLPWLRTFITGISHDTCPPLVPGPHTAYSPGCHHPLQTVPQTLRLLLRAAGWPVLASPSSHLHPQPGQTFPAKLWSVPGEESTPWAGGCLAPGQVQYHAVPEPCRGGNVYPWHQCHET